MSREPSFWDVKAHEDEEDRRFRQAISDVENQLALVRRTEALRSATGFSDFVAAVERLRDASRRTLEADSRLTNEGMREERGRIRAFMEILGLLNGQDVGDRLAAKLADLQNRHSDVLQRRPKPREDKP